MRRMSHSMVYRSTTPRLSSDIRGCEMPKYGATTCWLWEPPRERVISLASCRRSGLMGSSGAMNMLKNGACGAQPHIIFLLAGPTALSPRDAHSKFGIFQIWNEGGTGSAVESHLTSPTCLLRPVCRGARRRL